MKIINLGTSHGDATATRYQSSTLIETGGRYYLVDAGEPASASLIRRGILPAQITAAFITHPHIDHSGGLPVLVEQAHKYRRLHPAIRPEFLLPEERGVRALLAWAEANRFGGCAETATLRAYGPGTAYDDGTLKLTAFPGRHVPPADDGTPACYAFRIEAEGKKVYFTGDVAADYGDFNLAAADGCDLVYSELTHYPLEKALPVLKQLSAGKLIFYHLHNPWQTPEGKTLALERCREAGLAFPVSLAFDGMETEL